MRKPFTPDKIVIPAMTPMLRKDNSFSWKGNFYSVPCGTYQGKGSSVVVRQEENDLIVMQSGSLLEICRHAIPAEKGLKVIKSDHRRDKTLEIEVLMLTVANQFNNTDEAKNWLSEINKLKKNERTQCRERGGEY